jgi:CubicO group peptidase (beta-lactamase class C family)
LWPKVKELDVTNNEIGIIYSNFFGTQSVDPNSPLVNTPLELDTTMWIASCTKLMTAIAVLQCVEKGLLHLDDDISTVLTEWKAPNIILAFDDAKTEPILEKAKGKITLRMLLTHQSGLGYPLVHPILEQYTKYKMEKTEMVTSRLVCNLSLVQSIELSH